MGIEARVAGASGRAAGAGVRRGATESDMDRPTVATTGWLLGIATAPVATIHPDCDWTIAGMPYRRVTRVSLTWRLMPPIGRTRVVVTPDNDIVVPPIKIAIQPHANRKADAEGDKGRAIRQFDNKPDPVDKPAHKSPAGQPEQFQCRRRH